jgi:Ataxin-3
MQPGYELCVSRALLRYYRRLGSTHLDIIPTHFTEFYYRMSAKVYFEKQGGDRLCGVHCLNSLLQNPVFTQVDLNKYAAELDKEESALLAGKSNGASAPRSMTISSFSNQPESQNMDYNTGYFSLGVLEKALSTKYNLTVENAARRDIVQDISRNGFVSHEGFVIHLSDHWFSARRLGSQWYFLDSLKSGPQPVSENDLWGTLQGLIQSGNNVFIISGGKLPEPCGLPGKPRVVLKAHQFLLTPDEIQQRLKSPPSADEPNGGSSLSKKPRPTDWESLGTGQSLTGAPKSVPIDDDMKRAIQESLSDIQLPPEPSSSEPANNIWHVSVRLPSGTRVGRKFTLSSSTLADLFRWVEYISLSNSVSVSSDLSLVGRGLKITRLGDGMQVNDHVFPASVSLGQVTGISAGQDLLNLGK